MNTILDYLIRVRGGQQGQRELRKLAGGLNTFTGRLQAMIGVAAFAAPALISIASSATAAGIAAGTVGAAGIAALGVSLSGVALVGKSAIDQIKKVKTAQDAMNLAVQQYGPASDEATSARARFNAVVAQQGGDRTLALLNDLNALTGEFTKRTEGARVALTRTFGAGLRAAIKLLPAFTEQTNLGANAVRRGLTNSFRQLSGGEIKADLQRFGNAGAVSIQPILHGLTDIAFAILRLLRPALRYVVQAAFGFQAWAHSVRTASSDTGRMSVIVEVLVGHLKAWWGLAKALGRTLLILFSGSMQTGKGLVVSLTQIVDRMNAWLEHAREVGSLQRFFDGNANAIRRILTVLAPVAAALALLAQSLLPALHSAGGATSAMIQLFVLRAQALADIITFLGPAAGPLLVAFVAWRASLVALGVAQGIFNAALFLGGKILDVVTAAQWLWNAAMTANPIGLVIVAIAALIGVIVLLIKHWDWVKRAAQNAWEWIKDNWTLLLPLLAGPFAPFVALIQHYWDAIKEGFRSALNWIIEKWNGLQFTVPTLKIGGHNVIPGGGSKIGAPDIPMLAEGGNVRQRGAVVVGDAGPEVLDLPAGARVTPLAPQAAQFRDLIVKVDRRTLVRVTRDEIASQMARG